jgi:hypothetical protein
MLSYVFVEATTVPALRWRHGKHTEGSEGSVCVCVCVCVCVWCVVLVCVLCCCGLTGGVFQRVVEHSLGEMVKRPGRYSPLRTKDLVFE